MNFLNPHISNSVVLPTRIPSLCSHWTICRVLCALDADSLGIYIGLSVLYGFWSRRLARRQHKSAGSHFVLALHTFPSIGCDHVQAGFTIGSYIVTPG